MKLDTEYTELYHEKNKKMTQLSPYFLHLLDKRRFRKKHFYGPFFFFISNSRIEKIKSQ